jgi:hypothetical protein
MSATSTTPSIVALVAALALFFTRWIPAVPPCRRVRQP